MLVCACSRACTQISHDGDQSTAQSKKNDMPNVDFTRINKSKKNLFIYIYFCTNKMNREERYAQKILARERALFFVSSCLKCGVPNEIKIIINK